MVRLTVSRIWRGTAGEEGCKASGHGSAVSPDGRRTWRASKRICTRSKGHSGLEEGKLHLGKARVEITETQQGWLHSSKCAPHPPAGRHGMGGELAEDGTSGGQGQSLLGAKWHWRMSQALADLAAGEREGQGGNLVLHEVTWRGWRFPGMVMLLLPELRAGF